MKWKAIEELLGVIQNKTGKPLELESIRNENWQGNWKLKRITSSSYLRNCNVNRKETGKKLQILLESNWKGNGNKL